MPVFQDKLNQALGRLHENTALAWGGRSVYVNPRPSETAVMIARDGRIRGILDDQGDIYCWGYEGATHNDVANWLNITIHIPFTVEQIGGKWTVSPSSYRNHITAEQLKELSTNRYVRAMLAGLKWQSADKRVFHRSWLDD